MNQKSFHLRWNNHLQNLQSLFENLYNEQSLVDVTISCTDGQLYGHKLVLSACSPYFEKVFKENPCKHPTIILKGIKSREMQIILQYMYVGAVDVGEDELELLLDTATELQVKGLVQNTGEQQNTKEKNTKSTKESFTSREPSPVHHNGEELKWQAELVATSSSKRKNKESDRQREQVERPTEETSDSDSTMQIKVEPTCVIQDVKENANEEFLDFEEVSGSELIKTESVEESQEEMQFEASEVNRTESDEAVYFCHICIRSFQNKATYHRHMLTHAGVKPHSCSFCDQSFLRLSHLQRHIRVHTGERPYSCSRCPKQFARSDKLRQHYIIQHSDVAAARIPKPRGRPRKNHNSYGPPMGTLDPLVYPVMSGIGSVLSINPVPVTNTV
ncbi:longitudinals lacking protein, isoforms H/M/V-like isoform X2 [Macrosteles quadrilineatus]|uniref:longitudinals lacking protein, isoforms H/M/V-like isoform X2 n=1 Tax=Macrosteles quadrilineatus TaxID=74068 RepID=UPI0023E215C5|nr:longitudinals lacking protein, isoforms H/M/V-like isoform X2 [Macrosteles quadrilineatus]